MRWRLFTPLLLLGLALSGLPARAEEAWLDRFNRAMANANVALGEGVDALIAAMPLQNPIPPEWRGAGSTLLANTLHEPVTALSYAAMLDAGRAWTSLRRFGINVAQGYGGLVDRATEQGVVVAPADLGLALCAWGVPAGPFVVLPLMGGRTLRDGLADIALSSGLIYPALAPLLAGIPGASTLLSVPAMDEAATLLIARQLDPAAAEPSAENYDAVRAAYLLQRQARCTQIIGR